MPERLTEKYTDNSGYGTKQNNPQEQHLYIDLDAYEKCVAKLGQLEDIEEELGIDLTTFIKVLKSKNLVGHFNKYGQYDKKAIRKLRNIKLDIIKKRFLADDYGWVINIPLNFNKYGKTWALTKEELEK